MLFCWSPVLVNVIDRRLQFTRGAAHKICERLLHRCKQTPRLLIRVGSNNIYANHRIRVVQLFRRRELFPVDIEGGEESVGREMRSEGVRQSERRSEFSAERARSQNPNRNLSAGARHRPHSLSGFRWREERLQLQHVFGKTISARWIATQRTQRSRICAWRAAQAQVNPTRVK